LHTVSSSRYECSLKLNVRFFPFRELTPISSVVHIHFTPRSQYVSLTVSAAAEGAPLTVVSQPPTTILTRTAYLVAPLAVIAAALVLHAYNNPIPAATLAILMTAAYGRTLPVIDAFRSVPTINQVSRPIPFWKWMNFDRAHGRGYPFPSVLRSSTFWLFGGMRGYIEECHPIKYRRGNAQSESH
jgi:hypothetical protein